MDQATSAPSPTYKMVTPSDAHSARLNSLILDVRTPAEFDEMHIEGSELMPLNELDSNRVSQLSHGKDRCVLICRSGNRAKQAAEKLIKLGLPSIAILEGGLKAWEVAGLPLKRGKPMMSLERQVRISAGALVLLGSLLSYYVSSAWILLPAFVGAGLMFAGITDTCGMAMILARMPWNQRRS